ncbi:hypothetical protein OIO90_001067 [Microbotryomycetes sp. JL221]|nr:hypothetical protein OIO90_001067 [Microbotryomycetes sp. JL221]
MDDSRKKSLAFLWLVNIAQIVAWSIVLAREWNKTCDTPLKTFLVLTCVRLALALPVSTWSALVPRPPRRHESPESIAQREAQRRFGSFAIDRRIRRLADLYTVYGCVVFFLGNIWFFSSSNCSQTANLLYNAGLVALILSWIYAAEAILLLLACIFFLPILLIGMRWVGYGPKHEVGPMEKAEIDKLPLAIYIGELPDADSPTSVSSNTPGDESMSSSSSAHKEEETKATVQQVETSTHPTSHPQPSNATNTDKKSNSNKTSATQDMVLTTGVVDGMIALPAGMQPLRLPPSQASCSICLIDYEVPPMATDENSNEWEPEPLRLLPCGHAFHAPCLESWLVVSGRCPLCQRPADKNVKEDAPPAATASDPANSV